MDKFLKFFSVLVCISTTVLIYSGVGNYPDIRDTILACLLLYFGVDLLKTKEPQMIIHHLAVCAIIGNYFISSFVEKDINYIARLLLMGEISSIFLGIKRIMDPSPTLRKTKVYMVNDAIFVLTFLYFRTYTLVQSLFDPELYRIIFSYNTFIIPLLSLLSLYVLNAIWTYEILRMVHRKLNR